jgi:hypothetical protein
MGSTETKSTFFTSMTFDVLDRSEKSFYGFTVNASGSVMGKGTCSEGADLIGKAVAQTMQEIQDSVVTRLTTSDKLKEMSSLEIVK